MLPKLSEFGQFLKLTKNVTIRNWSLNGEATPYLLRCQQAYLAISIHHRMYPPLSTTEPLALTNKNAYAEVWIGETENRVEVTSHVLLFSPYKGHPE